jgi:hypothetical protein
MFHNYQTPELHGAESFLRPGYWVQYHVPKNLPQYPVLSQMNLVHILPLYFSKIHFNIVTWWLTSSMPVSPKWCLHFSISNWNLVYTSPMYATCPTHIVLLNLITIIISLVESTNYEASHYAIFSRLLLFLSNLSKCFPRHPVLKAPSTYVLRLR